MDHHVLAQAILFLGIFLAGTTVLSLVTQKLNFPYTVALLLIGIASQLVVYELHIPLHLHLDPQIIYLFLLPILLFEAAVHINVHQFRRQFKTITFFATFALLISIAVIGIGAAWLLGLPLGIALLFGAIISATDPIAVLALFKSLGAPKRLALVADGESMFNDATGVIAFKLIAAFVIANQVVEPIAIAGGIFNFTYVFIGSIILGLALGFIFLQAFRYLQDDRVLITSLSIALALGSFLVADHYIKLSGVITTVIAGLVIGNFGRTKLPAPTLHFMEEFFGYFGHLAISLVFFFAAYDLNLALFTADFGTIAIAITVVLIARAISVYGTAFITNRSRLFKDEPSIPLPWQHILNWGGLRGVIPLVLAYSLPETFGYREELIRLTLATLLFTLLVNGLTIKSLLLKLKLHLPRPEEHLIAKQQALFALYQQIQTLKAMADNGQKQYIADQITSYTTRLTALKNDLLASISDMGFLMSIRLQAVNVQRATLAKLFETGMINESVYAEYEIQLDMLQDTIEYPELALEHGEIDQERRRTRASYRKRLRELHRKLAYYPLVGWVLAATQETFLRNRYSMLRTRIVTSDDVFEYLDQLETILGKAVTSQTTIVRQQYQRYRQANEEELTQIETEYPTLANEYAESYIENRVQTSQLVHI